MGMSIYEESRNLFPFPNPNTSGIRTQIGRGTGNSNHRRQNIPSQRYKIKQLLFQLTKRLRTNEDKANWRKLLIQNLGH